MLSYYKTYHINTDSTEIATIDQADIVYLNSVDDHGWCNSLSKISQVFFNAQLKSTFNKNPAHCCIIVSDWLFIKRKAEDPYIGYERIEFIINNMIPPDNGIIISVYTVNKTEEKDIFWPNPYERGEWTRRHANAMQWPFHTNIIWKMKNVLNNIEKKDYVTWQKVEKNTFQKLHFRSNFEDNIAEALEMAGLEYKEISYAQTPETNYEILKHSKCHISYTGASWWLAHYMDIPVIGYGASPNCAFGSIGFPGAKEERSQMAWCSETKTFYLEKVKPDSHITNHADRDDIFKTILESEII